MSTVSTVPAAIDALVTLAGTVAATFTAAGKDVQVIDSSAKSDGSKTQIVLGYAGGHLADSVDDTQTLSGLRVDRDMESYSLAGLVSTWQGDGAFKAPRDLAYSVVDALHDVIAADKTLGRVVLQARIAEVAYVPKITDKGPTVDLPFRIEITGRRAAA